MIKKLENGFIIIKMEKLNKEVNLVRITNQQAIGSGIMKVAMFYAQKVF